MPQLAALPNVGKVLESYLLRVGITTPEELQRLGAKETFLRIRLQIDPEACLHLLYGIQGAIEGIPDKFLSEATRQRLRTFYKSL